MFKVWSVIVIFVMLSASAVYAAPKVVKLPEPKMSGEVSVEKAINERRSVRDFSDKALSLDQVSQLLWAAGGKTLDGVTGPTRAYPSAGGIYPLEIYLVAGKVEGLAPGIYKYNWKRNFLELIKTGDARRTLTRAAMGQDMIRRAPATMVISARYDLVSARYGRRGVVRYVAMDAGHMGQNVHLEAQALGLGTVMVGSFVDSEVGKIIGSGKDTPIYIMPLGYKM